MTRFGEYLDFAAYAASGLGEDRFTLVDVGCSRGINPHWRVWGERLRAFCFDPNVEEVERLRRSEDLPGVVYTSGLVGAPSDHPFVQARGIRANTGRNPWGRLSVADTLARQAEAFAQMSVEERTQRNLWPQLTLDEAPIVLADFLGERGVDCVDFVKIDIDGRDFEVLQSLPEVMLQTQILGFALEVNYIGEENDTDHTFHNTDRFMRTHGFDLFDLSVYRYSNRQLPSRYMYHYPAVTAFGRPLQGDALYLRDICSDENHNFAATLAAEKKLKSAVLFSLFGLPDCAAEVLTAFEEELAPSIDIEPALDLLAIQAQLLCGIRDDAGGFMSYRDYVEAFRADRPIFYSG